MLISKLDLYKAEWLDLVFDKRNKNYGAYELRQHYAGNMSKAIAITVLGFVGTAITLSILAAHKDNPQEATRTVVVELKKVNVQPPKEQLYKAQPQPAHKSLPHSALPTSAVKTIVVPVMRPSDQGVAEPPKLIDIEKEAIGPVSSDGKEGVQNIPPASGNDHGGRSAPGGSESTEVLPIADVMPEPIGGSTGWSKFLQRNLHYPVAARENGVEGKVLVSFVVERDGHLSDIKILRGIGSGCDEEAIRVLKLAPSWKPGIQNGRAVRVQYTIPINFQLAEE